MFEVDHGERTELESDLKSEVESLKIIMKKRERETQLLSDSKEQRGQILAKKARKLDALTVRILGLEKQLEGPARQLQKEERNSKALSEESAILKGKMTNNVCGLDEERRRIDEEERNLSTAEKNIAELDNLKDSQAIQLEELRGKCVMTHQDRTWKSAFEELSNAIGERELDLDTAASLCAHLLDGRVPFETVNLTLEAKDFKRSGTFNFASFLLAMKDLS
mmetsp:Transcript_24791/g.61996  ORF Transcript_24791/g.61996 Transcript_24791/m.61996 type:complete len:222 (+) Transcript_24791:449-1114(+)